jgi:hypothetical protein
MGIFGKPKKQYTEFELRVTAALSGRAIIENVPDAMYFNQYIQPDLIKKIRTARLQNEGAILKKCFGDFEKMHDLAKKSKTTDGANEDVMAYMKQQDAEGFAEFIA